MTEIPVSAMAHPEAFASGCVRYREKYADG